MNLEQEEEILALTSIYGEDKLLFDSKSNEGSLAVEPNVAGRLKLQDADKSRDQASEIAYLPEIKLHFKFVPKYPSEEAPGFRIESSWLTDVQIDKACTALKTEWDRHAGHVILFHWASFLEDIVGLLAEDDGGAVLTVADAAAFELLKMYSAARERCSCEICFDDALGRADLVRVSVRCGHSYCKSCVTSHCESCIQRGLMTNVTCPDPDCNEQVDASVVKNLVRPELFEVYDNALLNFALRSMPNTVWCPRKLCQHPAQADEVRLLGECAHCGFAFCLRCERAYHGQNPCKSQVSPSLVVAEDKQPEDSSVTTSQDLKAIESLLGKGGNLMVKKHVNAVVNHLFGHLTCLEKLDIQKNYQFWPPEKQEEYDSFYGKPFMVYLVLSEVSLPSGLITGPSDSMFFIAVSQFMDALSQEQGETARSKMYKTFVELGYDEMIRPCPFCLVPIQKNLGCHHMHCTLCHNHFCWNCRQSMKDCGDTNCRRGRR